MKILYLISNLGTGGAELSLKRLAVRLSKEDNNSIVVISLSNIGDVGNDLQKHGIILYAINFNTIFLPISVLQLYKQIKKLKPDVIHTWMYHADFIGGLLGKLAGVRKIVWSIRNTDIPQRKFSITSFIRFLNTLLSWFIPNIIVCNSYSGMKSHIKLGFCKRKMVVIPNSYLPANSELSFNKEQFKLKYDLNQDNFIIAAIGRFDKLKDFNNFIKASKIVSEYYPKAKYLLIGLNLDNNNKLLLKWIIENNQLNNFILLGYQKDISCYLNDIIDIFCLSSKSEGFPNVLLEAMSFEVPCVATNVGDVSLILENNGIIVPPNNSIALANGLIKMINTSFEIKSHYGKVNKNLINYKYSNNNISNIYQNLYKSII